MYSVGKTRSDKIIYCTKFQNDQKAHMKEICANFNDDELFDHFVVFEYLSVRAKRRKEFDEPYEWYRLKILKFITGKRIPKLRHRAGLKGAFDHAVLARRLVAVEFRDD